MHVITCSLSTRVAVCTAGMHIELHRPGTIVFQYQEVVASYGNHVPCNGYSTIVNGPKRKSFYVIKYILEAIQYPS